MVILDWPTRNLGYLRRYCQYLGMGRNDWTPKMDCWMQLWMDTDGDYIMAINGDQWWWMVINGFTLRWSDVPCWKKKQTFSWMIVSAGNLHLVQGFPSPCRYPGYGIMTLLPWCSNQIAGIKKVPFRYQPLTNSDTIFTIYVILICQPIIPGVTRCFFNFQCSWNPIHPV